MLQKQRKAGEPTTPEPTFGGAGAKAALAAQLGRTAMSNLDRVAETARKQALEQEQARRAAAVRSCVCG